MRLPCPFCGLRDDGEFSFEGPADHRWPALEAPAEEWLDAVFLRDQPAGRAREIWRHGLGCGAWLIVERDIRSHEILSTRLAHPGEAAALDGEGEA